MHEPDLVKRAEDAATALEDAWMRWHTRHGFGPGPLPPVTSYVGYSVEEPWGQPRVVFGVAAEEAERLAAIMDSDDYVDHVHAGSAGWPAPYLPYGTAHVAPGEPAADPAAAADVGPGVPPQAAWHAEAEPAAEPAAGTVTTADLAADLAAAPVPDAPAAATGRRPRTASSSAAGKGSRPAASGQPEQPEPQGEPDPGEDVQDQAGEPPAEAVPEAPAARNRQRKADRT